MDDQMPRVPESVSPPSGKKFWETTKGVIPETVAQYLVGGVFALLVIAGTAFKDEVLTWQHARHNNSPQVLQDAATRDREIYDILAELRTEFKADRALVNQLHNGDYWSNGSPIRKISTSYETDRLGVSSVYNSIRNISLTQVPDLLDMLTKTKGPTFLKTSQMQLGGYRDMLSVHGVECCILIPLYALGSNDQLIGELKLHWLNDVNVPTDMSAVEKAASRIEFLLSRKS